MTTELRISPEEQPRVEDALQTAHDLRDVLEARVHTISALNFHIVILEPLVDTPITISTDDWGATKMQRRSRQDLADLLLQFEDKYGFPTVDLPDRIRTGEIVENLDTRRWLSLRAIQQRMTQ